MVEKVVLGEMESTAGSRFISSTNFETNTFNLIMVQQELDDNKKLLGSRASFLGINLGKLYNSNLLNWHKCSSEVVDRGFLDPTISNIKFQAMLEKVSNQLCIARVSLNIKANRIK